MAELTQTEFEMLYLRRSVEDCEFILELLKADGEITVVPDRFGGCDRCAEEVQVGREEEARDRREGQAPDRREGQAQDALEVEPCLHRRSTGGHTVPNQQGGRGSSLNRISLTETSLF